MKAPMRPPFLLLGLTTQVYIGAVQASTVTFNRVDLTVPPITAPTRTFTIPAQTAIVSWSQEGDSDGSETTYVERVYVSQGLGPDSSRLVPLSSTQTQLATLVQSSGGYWYSKAIPISTNSAESQVIYQTCSRDANSGDGNHACVEVLGAGESSTTLSYTNTARQVVVTDVAGVPSQGNDDNGGGSGGNSATINAGKISLQLLFVLSTMVGGVLVAL
ncbi:hypothetical protein AAF712_006738 [Marasmius tenuissimus]|uniref:Uncharacterized protein n=1 Tax=Marasmius tenuissimus TaxID=585030 RepID=A0ABR2ZZ29_9AGAR